MAGTQKRNKTLSASLGDGSVLIVWDTTAMVLLLLGVRPAVDFTASGQPPRASSATRPVAPTQGSATDDTPISGPPEGLCHRLSVP